METYDPQARCVEISEDQCMVMMVMMFLFHSFSAGSLYLYTYMDMQRSRARSGLAESLDSLGLSPVPYQLLQCSVPSIS